MFGSGLQRLCVSQAQRLRKGAADEVALWIYRVAVELVDLPYLTAAATQSTHHTRLGEHVCIVAI